MKDVRTIRRENMRLLEKEAGSATIASKIADMSLPQWANLRDGAKDSKTGVPRGMRDETARKIEVSFHKDFGWLDAEHDPNVLPSSDTKHKLSLAYSRNSDNEVILNHFDTGGGMGGGIVLRDQPGVINSWNVSREWITKNLKHYSGAANLCIVTGFGDSMRPMFNPGDPLIVDKGITTVEFDSIYFFRVGNEGFIKRLQRIPGEGIRAISENKAYESWTIKPDMDFEVFGRVLKVWCSEEF